MGTLKEEIESHEQLSDEAIHGLLNSLEAKVRGIRAAYLSTGLPPVWMTDFTHEAMSLMTLMSFRAQWNNIESKATKALPIPSKKLTVIGGMRGIRRGNN